MFVPSQKISTNSHALLTELDIDFDSIVITESRKVNDISKPIFPPINIVLADYAIEQTPNQSNAEGALFYINRKHSYKIRKDLKLFKPLKIKSVFVEVIMPKRTSDSPKNTPPYNKTKSQKVQLSESADISEKLLETLKETLHVGDAEDIFGAYVASELRSLDASRQRIGKIEITNTLDRLETSQFCGNVYQNLPLTYNNSIQITLMVVQLHNNQILG